MAFESLSEKLQGALKKISGQSKLTESNMNDMLKEVRMSLLEADVNYQVVKDFIASIKEKAMGEEVLAALNPGQMVVKIVKEELVNLLGQEDAKIHYAQSPYPTSIMMAGLQGTGKTTASGKIARYLKEKQRKKVLLAACDVVRPAAIEQLKTLGNQIGAEVFARPQWSAVETARAADAYARENGFQVVIYDTAGRLHVDEQLMEELREMQALLNPEEVLLTVDAMTGQDIVTVAREFNEKLNISGLVVTKMDGDARGGGLLSVRSITSVPVLFVSNGEKLEDLEEFHPDRMADRILGMGDMLSLIEQAQDRMDEQVLQNQADRMMAGIFTFNDLLAQLEQVNKMGSIQGLLKMVPGLGKLAKQVDEEQAGASIKKTKAIIQSMTPYEREHPACLKASRKKRIAAGSGVKVADVNKLIDQVNQMQSVTRMMSGGGFGGLGGFGGMGGMKNPAGMGGFNRGAGIPNSSKHAGSKKKKKKRKK